jgi:hypothetical protein
MILVYKSGSVVVACNKDDQTQLTLFDAMGDRLLVQSFPGHMCESDKCYGFDGSEFFFVGTEDDAITLYGVSTLEIITRIPTPGINPLFCSVKGAVALLRVDDSLLIETPFQSAVPTIIRRVV